MPKCDKCQKDNIAIVGSYWGKVLCGECFDLLTKLFRTKEGRRRIKEEFR